MELGNVHRDDPETSREAANASRHSWAEQRERLLIQFAEADLTYDEAGQRAGITAYNQRRRCSDLRKLGLIEPTGTTRPTQYGRSAQVCRITDAGREALATGEIPANDTTRQKYTHAEMLLLVRRIEELEAQVRQLGGTP